MGAVFAADIEKAKRLHVGSGTIYLVDYTNVELPSPESGAALAKDNPDGVKKWATTGDDYYGKLNNASIQKFQNGLPMDHTDLVCDVYGSFDNLPADDGTIEEVLSRQVFEHMSLTECKAALMECRRVLADDGILRIDVPDHEESLRQWKDCEGFRPFFKRHIFGSMRNDAAYHIMGWTRGSLVAFLDRYGFDAVEEEKNIHLYPAFCIRFRKRSHEMILDGPPAKNRQWFAAWEYCGEPLGEPLVVPDDYDVLEVGCGTRPWPRANHYVDIDEDAVDSLPEGRKLDFVNAAADVLPWFDGEFDFVFASHIMEHVHDPHAVASELSRVASAGCVVCPSNMKDALFGFHEDDHKWWALPTSEPNTLRLIRVDPAWREAIFDEDMSKAMHQMLRLEHRRFGAEGRKLKSWFNAAEPLLDVVVHWEGELIVEVLE